MIHVHRVIHAEALTSPSDISKQGTSDHTSTTSQLTNPQQPVKTQQRRRLTPLYPLPVIPPRNNQQETKPSQTKPTPTTITPHRHQTRPISPAPAPSRAHHQPTNPQTIPTPLSASRPRPQHPTIGPTAHSFSFFFPFPPFYPEILSCAQTSLVLKKRTGMGSGVRGCPHTPRTRTCWYPCAVYGTACLSCFSSAPVTRGVRPLLVAWWFAGLRVLGEGWCSFLFLLSFF
jgi:hypothetical protein